MPSRIRALPPASAWYAALTLFAAACGEAPTEPAAGDRVEPVPRPDVVRGVYVNAYAAGSKVRLDSLLELADRSSINTFVIDVKEFGEVSYASSVPLVSAIGAGRTFISDLPEVLRALRDHGVYPIARIVCFRDPILAEARPEWAIRTRAGGVWVDPETGRSWVDSYNPNVWAYNVDLAREALASGFAEIQWDYVRFPDVSDAVRADMVFPAQAGRAAGEAIADFVKSSKLALAPASAPVTVDVFGRVVTASEDSGIGQNFELLVRASDVLLPMVYPALYGAGSFGLANPNAEPYALVRASMDSATARLSRTSGAVATLRPWIQAYSDGGIQYGATEIAEQIRAVEDAGLREWLAWHPGSAYPPDAF